MSKTTLDIWNELMDERDLKCFTQFHETSKDGINLMREEWKKLRHIALTKLNRELNNSGKSGQLMNIDVSEDVFYPYLLTTSEKFMFFKYSRILDFADGYIPKGLIIIKKLN